MRKNINIKKYISLVLIFGAIIILAATTYYITFPKKQSPKAVEGKLNLSSWDFKKDGVTFLNGEWIFYPEKLLQPEELSLSTPYFIKVPNTWSKDREYLQPARGSGTYHLSITLPRMDEDLILKVQNIWMSHKLFINGSLVKEMGVPDYKNENHRPQNTPYLVRLKSTEKLDILIQVSNHVYYDGGIIHPMQLGEESYMELKYNLSFGIDMAGFFLFLMFGIYHLHMYQMRDKESTYLYSGIYFILVSFVAITSGEKLFMRVAQGLPFQVVYKLQDLFIFSSSPVLLLFIGSLEERTMNKKKLRIVIMPILAYLLLIIATPYDFYIGMKGYMSVYANVILFVFVFRLIFISFRDKERNLPLNEFFYVIVSVTCIAIALFHGNLYYSGYVSTNLIGKISLLAFLLSMNTLLARRFTNKMNEVQALSEELKKSNQIKDEFLARTSHEIKTPLNGIINISNHLLKEKAFSLTLEQKNNINLIQDTSIKLSILVNDLADAIKLKHEDIKLAISTVDLYVITEVAFQLLSFEAKSKNLKLINNIKPMTFVEADENRLRQILYNLISNAIKYTESGEITAKSKVQGKNIIFTIEDTGMGIEQNKWESIFQDSYIRILSEGSSDRGIGLGLYISRELARKMRGDIWISDSIMGQGTHISVRLLKGHIPSYHINKKDPQLKAKEEIEDIDKEKENKSLKKILVVDDEPTNIKILSLILGNEFEILKAYRGEEALKILQNHKVSLVITDIMMPGMSGTELIQRIRRSHSVINLPIIISIAIYNHKDIELAYQSGANDYITKPFSQEEIQSRVKSLIQLTEAMDNALKSQIAFLQAQIKPHFIYNALSNIIALCYEDGKKAAELLALLSRYLRHIFQTDQSNQMIPLYQELDIIKAYVEIERLRFGERLKYKTYINQEVSKDEIMVPTLMIQPLVENAIRHGLFDKEGEGTVTLTITEGEGYIRIIVEDDGVGISEDEIYKIMNNKEGKGVGIKNIQKRVEALKEASFSIDSELEEGTRCSLFLPKKMLKSLKKEVI